MTETSTITLTDFLLARIAEDKEIAFSGAPSPWREGEWDGTYEGPRLVLDRHGRPTAECNYGGTYGHVLRFDPTRILAECEAKRQIVKSHTWRPSLIHTSTWLASRECPVCHVERPCPTVRLLALPYADHADYRPEWQPDRART